MNPMRKHFGAVDVLLNITLVVMFLTLSSCSSDNDEIIVDKPPVVTDETPTQYGTPFDAVPDAPDAVIYQVNMRCFSESSNFKGVVNRLDSIKALGVNVIYLMPIYPVGLINSVNSPYCVKDYKGISSEFGTLTDLRSLIDGAHSRGMAVILDWVANHTSWDHSWMSNPSWYKKDANGNIVSPNGWNDVAQLNFQNAEMRAKMIDAMKYWVYTANCDGFRCDYSDGPPADFWKQAIDTLRKIDTHKLLMLAEGSRNENFSVGFDLNFGFKFYEQLKYIYQSNITATSFASVDATEYTGAGESNRVVRYVTNHDVNSSDGTPIKLFGGLKGSMVAFITASYYNGVPMIYNGQENGNASQMMFPFTATNIDWTYNHDVVSEYKKVIAFRNASAAIRRGAIQPYHSTDVCAFTKTLNNETVLVIANVRNTTINYSVASGLSGEWENVFTGASTTLNNSLSLAPYTYYVLKKK